MRNFRTAFIFVCVLAVAFTAASVNFRTETVTSRLGSQGEEVRQIQTKLKNIGYNVGKVDGIYGQQTRNAVIKYQKDNYLTPDGIAGPKTLQKLGISTSSASKANDNDVNLLARLINSEARGEPFEGQVAVGAVVLNRVKHPSFPNTIAGVIYQPGAFTAISDGQWNAAMTETPIKAARNALNGWDPSGGAIYYYNPAKTTSKWIYSRPVVTTIGRHVFAK